jgi:hypothetical protein
MTDYIYLPEHENDDNPRLHLVARNIVWNLLRKNFRQMGVGLPSDWIFEILQAADVLAAEDAHAPSIDRVIDDLGRGRVKDIDKGRLKHAIDTAPATPTEPAAGPKTAKPLPDRALRVTGTANTDVRSYR